MTTRVNPYDCRLIKHPDVVNYALGAAIPEFPVDPVAPEPEYAWVLRQSDGSGGSPIGLLLALTYSGSFRYYFSFRTLSGMTRRVELT